MAAVSNVSDRKVTLKFVNPSELRFDPTNPRFAADSKALKQSDIQTLLEQAPHYALELIPSFLENGFIDYEPLVVRAQEDHYIVVEGNRRLAAIKNILLNREEYEAKSQRIGDLEHIPVLVFPEAPSTQSEKEQRVYLGVRHLFGFREWPPESKARYLDGHVRKKTDLDRLSRELNIKRQDIQRYLVPFRLRKAAADLWHEHMDQDFWVLGEGLNRAGIKAYIGLDVDQGTLKVRSFDGRKLAHLLRFIYGTPAKQRADRVVKETRQLSSLAKVLQSKRATAALEKGRSLAEASVLLESLDESRLRLRDLLRESRTVIARLRHESGALEMQAAFRKFAIVAARFLKHGR